MPDDVANDTSERRRKPTGRHPDRRLTAVQVRRAGPGRHGDGNGLFLEVDPSGARRWILRTVVHGRRRDLGLGSAALVPLAEARELAQRFRAIARAGGDPVLERDKSKREQLTFADAARRVHREHIAANATNGKHVAQWLATLELYAFPSIGQKPVAAVDQSDILRVLAPIWTTKPETARRIRQRLRTVLDWARTAGYRDGINPVDGVDKGLARQRDKPEHFKALPWRDLPKLWTRLSATDGMGALALRFAILTGARSGEVRKATWQEIDLDNCIWTRPAAHMKSNVEHRVPLSEGAVAVLMEAQRLAEGAGALIFPSRQRGKALSDMTLAAVLKRLKVDATPHGFRSTFRDWAEETTDFPFEVKEAALAHVVRNKVERAYRRTDLFERRRDLMDRWCRYIQLGDV